MEEIDVGALITLSNLLNFGFLVNVASGQKNLVKHASNGN